MNYEDLITVGIAIGLGLLIGMQRERAEHHLGVRTFTLIAILGVISGFLAKLFDVPYIIPLIGLAVAALIIAGNFILSKEVEEKEYGQTTEFAALLMFALGAYLVMGNQVIGIVVGGIMAILLYAKKRLHGLIRKLKGKDIKGIMFLVGITLVILPVLPDETYGPYNVLNPQNIWLMVTLIVGISLTGYFTYKLVGKKAGIISNSILGGLISSTATTVSYARKAKSLQNISKVSAFVITGASAITFIRILIEIGIVFPEAISQAIFPITLQFLVVVLLCVFFFYYLNKDREGEEMPEPENPAQIKVALLFGLLYAIILLAVAFVKNEFGEGGLYLVSIISGLTNVDAITLSLSQIMKKGQLEIDLGWRLILLASLSNILFKGIIVAVLGPKRLIKWVTLFFSIAIASGLLIIWLWP